jgi:hypothetical protein
MSKSEWGSSWLYVSDPLAAVAAASARLTVARFVASCGSSLPKLAIFSCDLVLRLRLRQLLRIDQLAQHRP